jgi:hypothetical protein
MHLNDGELRAYQDQELGLDRDPQVRAHLEGCKYCQERAFALQERRQDVSRRLNVISPEGEAGPIRATEGRRRLAEALQTTQQEKNLMNNHTTTRRLRPLWVGLAIVAVLAIALAFPQVRAAANNFLGLFRVQQIAVVQFDPQTMQMSDTTSAQIESVLSEDVTFEEIGEFQKVASPEEAEALAGFDVRLPESIVPSGLEVQPGGQATFAIDLPRLQALLDAIGKSDIELPGELQGQPVTLNMPMAVTANLENCKIEEPVVPEGQEPGAFPAAPWQDACIMLIQMPSPSINAPQELDVTRLGQAYLQLLGMSESDAAQYASTVDWTTTFVLPLPGYDASYRELPVDGVQGTLIQMAYDPEFGSYTLLWVKNGILYALTGAGDPARGLELANSLK